MCLLKSASILAPREWIRTFERSVRENDEVFPRRPLAAGPRNTGRGMVYVENSVVYPGFGLAFASTAVVGRPSESTEPDSTWRTLAVAY